MFITIKEIYYANFQVHDFVIGAAALYSCIQFLHAKLSAGHLANV